MGDGLVLPVAKKPLGPQSNVKPFSVVDLALPPTCRDFSKRLIEVFGARRFKKAPIARPVIPPPIIDTEGIEHQYMRNVLSCAA